MAQASSDSKNLISRYSAPSAFALWRNEYTPELIVGIEQRATNPAFQGCGVLTAVIKLASGKYRVRLTVQYALGGQQYLKHSEDFDSLRSAYRSAHGLTRSHYHKLAERKFAVDLLGDSVSVLD